jgi:uncharacterized protein (DUF1800 family)
MTAMTFDDAAHLYRRMGFGGTPDEINNLMSMGREGAVNYLINYGSIDDSALTALAGDGATAAFSASSFNFSDPNNNTNFSDNEIKRWWMTRMALTKRQFQEKMTLFWHNHFASSLSKVPRQYMYIQNLTLRSHALDRFDSLLLAVAQDPAMILFLDTNTNIKAHANENWARELQELFTMGQNNLVTGQPNYTQVDITQIAKAFTGWSFAKTPNSGPFDYHFFVNAGNHDNTVKTIYQNMAQPPTPANYDGSDIVTIIAAREETGQFLVKKLFEFFVYPLDLTNSADIATVAKFAHVYLNNDHSIKSLVTSIFTSDEFFSDRARFGLIKNPAEMIVSAIRMSGGVYVPGTLARRDATLYTRSKNMGMDLFDPPGVQGWALNTGWINTASMLERFNYANALATLRPADTTTVPGASIPSSTINGFVAASAKKTVRRILSTLGPLDLGDGTKALKIYLMSDDSGNIVGFSTDATTIDKKVRGLFHLVLSAPEFQLN